MPYEIVKPGTKIDFIGKRRLCAMLSAGLIIASLIATQVNGIKLGIDFAGGTEVQLTFEPQVDVTEGPIREIVSAIEGIDDPSVIRYGDPVDNEFLVKFQGSVKTGDASAGVDRVTEIQQAVIAGIGPLRGGKISRVEFVGPKVGPELRNDGLSSLFYASLVVLAYIAFRFSSRFAPGAILAVLHDLTVTAGIFVMLGLEFDLRILAAMLAILGYSLNDTIIIYDRIRENLELHTKHDLAEVLNLSVNQTLSRTILTSATTLLALASLYFLGGEIIRPFAFAMVMGVLVGTYSSIFIASPTLLLLEGRFASK
ncbi:MAG TPA: protein translocase subunit SecF [Myxococcales bacterium]|nr:protein translocase subunit SecF [Myxococcales bacterium]